MSSTSEMFPVLDPVLDIVTLTVIAVLPLRVW